MFAVLFLILVTTYWILYYHWRRRRMYELAKQFQGPRALPIIGNGLSFLCKNEEILNRIDNIVKNYYEDYLPTRIWIGPKLLIIFTHPDHIEKILSSQKFSYKSELYDFVKNYLGEGLVTASGPTYKIHKKLIQPLLNIKFVSDYYEVIRDGINNCLIELENHLDGNVFDVHHVLHVHLSNMIAETILGYCNASGNDNDIFRDATVEAYDVGFTRILKPWLHSDFIYNVTSSKRKERKLKKIMNEFMKAAIDDSKGRTNSKKVTNTGKIPIIDQITAILEGDPKVMNNDDFLSHMLTLYLASEDTITEIASMLCVCFGMYPEHQNRAAQEIRDLFGESPKPVTMDDLRKLEYVNMCISDVLRLVPIAPNIVRKILEECEIDNWKLPAGSSIVVPIFTVHRDPRHWSNPEHFHPDHFLPEAVNKRHTYSYLPFSAGPRGCIGKIIANTYLRLFVASFLQRYEVEADGKFPDFKLKMDISVRSLNGCNIRIKKRVWKQN